jgi:hypothetical protein
MARICDRCFGKGDSRIASDAIIFERTDEKFDLCESCIQVIQETIRDMSNIDKEPSTKRGRPRKET